MSAPKKLDPAAIRGRAEKASTYATPADVQRVLEEDVPALLERIEALEGALRELQKDYCFNSHKCMHTADGSSHRHQCADATRALAGQPEAGKDPEDVECSGCGASCVTARSEGSITRFLCARCAHPTPDAVRGLVEALENFRTWHADHFGDFDATANAQLLCLDNDARAALAALNGEK